MVDLKERLEILFPDINFGDLPTLGDCFITKEKIITWNRVEPQPTEQELLAVPDEQINNLKASAKRATIKNKIYGIRRKRNDQIIKSYSLAEGTRWERDRKEIELGNFAYFNARAGAYMTGQEYVEQRIKPKIEAGDHFVDQNIAKCNDLVYLLDQTPDANLEQFDYTSIWDEEVDYTEPVEFDTQEKKGWWRSLMDGIPWKINIFGGQ
jgi:hypothetical protein